MKTTLKTLALIAGLSSLVASTALSPALAGMSTQDWYKRVESTRKPGEDHPWVVATVKAINAGAGTLTIAHAAIPQAKMPGMTMTFPVRDPSDLTAHKVGDRVTVQVDSLGGAIKIVHIQSVRG